MLFLIINCVCLLIVSTLAAPDIELCLEEIVNGQDMLDIDFIPNTNKAFVSSRNGVIRVLDLTDNSVSDLATLKVTAGGERGLLSLVLHPNFSQNAKIYTMYSDVSSGNPNVVAEFVVSKDLKQLSDKREVITITQRSSNHNGGDLLFNKDDGYLYISLGDEGGSNDTYDNGQKKSTLQGKILRIDVDARTAGEYGIPNDNPFLADSDYRPEIFVMGLRNPWRCSFDTDAPSKLYCGDVGQNAWEEVDVLDVKQIIADKYSNLGWPIFEGLSCNTRKSTIPKCMAEEITFTPKGFPIFQYNNAGGASVVGGFVYHGKKDYRLPGKYIFADYANCVRWDSGSRYYSTSKCTNHNLVLSDRLTPCNDTCQLSGESGATMKDWITIADVKVIGSTRGLTGQIWSFGQDNNGEVYVVTVRQIYRIAEPYKCDIGTRPPTTTSTSTAATTTTTTVTTTAATTTAAPDRAALCANGVQDAGEQCQPTDGACCNKQTCQFEPKDKVCREKKADLPCDAVDVCSGDSAVCVDAVQLMDIECAPGNGTCVLPSLCDGKTGLCPPLSLVSAAGQECRDGDKCTEDETCSLYGTCTGRFVCACVGSGVNQMCDTDKNACTIDKCEDGKCVRTFASAGTACNDGDVCTVGDRCDSEGNCAGERACLQGCNEPHGQCCGSTCTCTAAFKGPACLEPVQGCVIGTLRCPCTSGGGCDGGLACECPGGKKDPECSIEEPICLTDTIRETSSASKFTIALVCNFAIFFITMI